MKTLEEKYASFVNNMSFFIPDSKYDQNVKLEIDRITDRIRNHGKDLKAVDVHKMMEEDPVGTYEFVRISTGVSKEAIKNLFSCPTHLPNDIKNVIGFDEWSNEWKGTDSSIKRALLNDPAVRRGMTRIFVHGHSLSRFTDIEDQRKFDVRNIRELAKSPRMVVRRIVEQQLSGRYRVAKSIREEEVPKRVLDLLGIQYVNGNKTDASRNMDCIIGTEDNPEAYIECTYYSTSSSNQTEKSSRFAEVVTNARKQYKNLKVYLFIDGPGWLRRPSDLKTMLEVADDNFTYKKSEIKRFAELMEVEDFAEAA